MFPALIEWNVSGQTTSRLPLSLPLQVMTSVKRDSFVGRTLSVKTGILKPNVNAGAATPPSMGTPHTVKVGHLGAHRLKLYGWQQVRFYIRQTVTEAGVCVELKNEKMRTEDSMDCSVWHIFRILDWLPQRSERSTAIESKGCDQLKLIFLCWAWDGDMFSYNILW